MYLIQSKEFMVELQKRINKKYFEESDFQNCKWKCLKHSLNVNIEHEFIFYTIKPIKYSASNSKMHTIVQQH